MRLIRAVSRAGAAAIAVAGVLPGVALATSAMADDWNRLVVKAGCSSGNCDLGLYSSRSSRSRQRPVTQDHAKKQSVGGSAEQAAAPAAFPAVPPDCYMIELDHHTCIARGSDDEDPAPAAPSGEAALSETVVQQAMAQLQLPKPVIRMSPDAGAAQVVRFPMWLWIDASGWRQVSKTVQVPGASLTATATPQRVIWSMGDGGSVTCAGPGTPYSSHYPAGASSPDCGYVYQRSSAGQPDERFTVKATVVWDVAWQGAGKSGTVPGMEMTSQVPVRVSEVQSVVVARSGRI